MLSAQNLGYSLCTVVCFHCQIAVYVDIAHLVGEGVAKLLQDGVHSLPDSNVVEPDGSLGVQIRAQA